MASELDTSAVGNEEGIGVGDVAGGERVDGGLDAGQSGEYLEDC